MSAVELSGADALALARTLDVVGVVTASREQLEPLARAMKQADQTIATGTALRDKRRLRRELQRTLEATIKDVARAGHWRHAGVGMNVDEVHRNFDLRWCEHCGGACSDRLKCWATHPHPGYTEREAFKYRKGSRGLADALILHTGHLFEACESYADKTGCRVIQLPYSWHGYTTAALFERKKLS
jgi:hypothetical protein